MLSGSLHHCLAVPVFTAGSQSAVSVYPSVNFGPSFLYKSVRFMFCEDGVIVSLTVVEQFYSKQPPGS